MTRGGREAVLSSIREGLDRDGRRRTPAVTGLGGEGVADESRRGRQGRRSRESPFRGSESRHELLRLFSARVSDYRAGLVQVRAPELPGAIARSLEARQTGCVVVPSDLPREWLAALPPRSPGVLWDGAEGGFLSNEQLDSCHSVLTGCALGIAETGTIVLDGGLAQGRRVLTLLPDHHLCVVFGGQVVETVSEAVTAMGVSVRELDRPLTLISGPSATSDIELVRVEGVHGPRKLEVILVDEPH